MSSSSSHSPFAKSAAARGSRVPSVARRVFTRAPFEPTPAEVAHVVDHGGPLVSAPVAAPFSDLPAIGDAGSAVLGTWSVAASAAYVQPLRRRDRSLYAWFESVGFLLGAVAVGGAWLALMLR